MKLFDNKHNPIKNLIYSLTIFLLSLQLVNTSWAIEDESFNASVNVKCYERDWKGISHFQAKVAKNVDGDTIKILYRNKQYNVRFLSIDTPETHYFGKSQGHWGDVAAEKMQSLIPVGSTVDVEIEEGNTCDRYGRLLAYIHYKNMNINEEMVRSCLAVMYCIYPSVSYCSEFGELNTACIQNKEGIFSDSSLEIPYEWRRRQSNRPLEKWVLNLRTQEVFAPKEIERVPVGDRLFFMRKSDLQKYLTDLQD